MKRILLTILAAGTMLAGVAHADATEFFYRYRGMGPQVASVETPEVPETPADEYKNAFSLGASWGGGTPVTVDITLPFGIQAKGPITVDADPNAYRIPPGDLPSANGPWSSYSSHRTVEARDAGGNAMMLDLFVAVSGTGAIEVTFFDAATASDPEYFFPFSGGPLVASNVLF
jgi:hypothetical protein